MRVERETILCLTLELRFAYRPASKVVKKLTKIHPNAHQVQLIAKHTKKFSLSFRWPLFRNSGKIKFFISVPKTISIYFPLALNDFENRNLNSYASDYRIRIVRDFPFNT